MRITESRLREVIRQVLRESMDGEMAPMPADAIRAFANKGSNDDMMQLHKDGYVSDNLNHEVSSKFIIDIARALKPNVREEFDIGNIVESCVLDVLRKEINVIYTDSSLADLSYTDFRIHLQNNADSIAQEMMNECHGM
jgi:hypothetical protein